jgi:hypothetical protein
MLHDAIELESFALSDRDDSISSLSLSELEADSEREGQPMPAPGGRRKSKESFMLYTPDEERLVLQKLDRRLVLLLAILYMLSFLDRSSTFRCNTYWSPEPCAAAGLQVKVSC